MYDELVKRMRKCATEACACRTCELDSNPSCTDVLMEQAADAIEELVGFVQETERDRDEYRERLDKANDAIEELQGNGSVKYVPVVVDTKPKPTTNADRIRAMTDEELADWLVMNGDGSDYQTWLDLLKKEVTDG